MIRTSRMLSLTGTIAVAIAAAGMLSAGTAQAAGPPTAVSAGTCATVTSTVSTAGRTATWQLTNPGKAGCKTYVATYQVPDRWDGYRADTTAYPQTIYRTSAVLLNPGQTASASLPLPPCGPWAAYTTHRPPPVSVAAAIPAVSYRMGGAHTTCDPVPVTGAYTATLTGFCGGATAAFAVDVTNSLPVTFHTSQAGTLTGETLTEQPGQSDMTVLFLPAHTGTQTVSLVATEGAHHRVLQVVQVPTDCPV